MKKFLKESLVTLEKKFPGISKKDLQSIWEADPSGNNHWSKKIAQFYSEGQVGLGPILITIERYFDLTQRAKGARVSVKDINSFSTYNSFDNYVNQLEGQVKKRVERFKKKQNFEIVHEDSDWYVLYPKDYDTLATLGKDSDWCTAKRESTYNNYRESGEFLILIDRKLFKEYKENFTPKEDRNPNYKFLIYGEPFKIIKNSKEEIYLEIGEFANLKNEHQHYDIAISIIKQLDYSKIFKNTDVLQMVAYVNSKGQYHKEDGPAVFISDITQRWYQNGALHREDGPAVEENNGYKEWWLNDKRYSERNWNIEIEHRKFKGELTK